MNRKWLPFVVIGVLALILVLIKVFKHDPGPGPGPRTTDTEKEKDPASVNRNRGFDRRISFLEYSEHASCRMQCRHISKAEVEEIMRSGKINYRKSELKNVRCPRYAVEGITDDDQRVRIVYAQCDQKTVVVTVIDLDREWQCDCPNPSAN